LYKIVSQSPFLNGSGQIISNYSKPRIRNSPCLGWPPLFQPSISSELAKIYYIYISNCPFSEKQKHMPNIQICVPHTQFFHGGCGRQNPDLPRCLKACARTKDNNEARACGRSSHCRSSCGAPWLVQKLGIPIGNHRENGDFINKTWGFHGIYSWFMIAKLTHITRLTMVHARYIYSWCDL